MKHNVCIQSQRVEYLTKVKMKILLTLRNSKVQTCDLKVLHRALATVLSYILHNLSLNRTFHGRQLYFMK